MRPLVQIVVVLVSTAIGLRVGDALPGLLTGIPRGVVVCSTLSEASALTSMGVPLPPSLAAYQPAFRGIRATRAPHAALAVALRSPAGKTLAIFRGDISGIDSRLYRPLHPFHEIVTQVAGQAAMLRASNQAGGPVVQDLEWTTGGMRTVLRFDGTTLELLHVAEQLARLAP